ncbi:class I SAM-dependent methyltransferase [Paraburkholderia sp.]|uniref:class I SAM-dependent methyltransferase n=1 Tax=Paraburkholderia sp. TaxID=1926495 RepID=UPI003D6EFA65
MTHEAAAQFDELAPMYEDMANWPFRKDIEIPSVLETIGEVTSLDVLDYGCGTASYARWLKARGAHRVVGYDPTTGMLNYARARAEKEGSDIPFIQELTPELNEKFDLVLAVYILPFATTRDELNSMCAEMARLLRPNGRLVTLPIHPDYDSRPSYYEDYGFKLVAHDHERAPHADGGRVRLELSYKEHRASVDAWYWSKATLEDALSEAGLTDIRWVDPHAPAYADSASAPDSLRAYLDRPHTVVIEARKT